MASSIDIEGTGARRAGKGGGTKGRHCDGQGLTAGTNAGADVVAGNASTDADAGTDAVAGNASTDAGIVTCSSKHFLRKA